MSNDPAIRTDVNLRSLDVLRGLIAVYVLAGHARWLLWAGHAQWTSQPHSLWANTLAYASSSLRYGYEMVMVFFVLSGFFVHLRSARNLSSGTDARLDIGRFFKRRAHRLLVPYFFALLLTVILDAIGRYFFPVLYVAQTNDARLDAIFAYKDYSIKAVFPALFILPSTLGRDFGTNAPLWFLAYQTAYYLFYPVWHRLRLWNATVSYGLIPTVCLALTFYPVQTYPVLVITHYLLWLAGAALAEWFCRYQVPAGSVIVAGLLGLVAFALHHVHLPFGGLLVHFTLSLSLVWCFALIPVSWSERWWHRAWEFLGLRSYTTYIIHFPVLALISSCVITTQGVRPLSGWLAFGGVALTLGFCLVVFEVCEKSFMHARLRASTP